MMIKMIASILCLVSTFALAQGQSTSVTEASSPQNHHWQVGVGPALTSGINAPDLVASWKFGYGFKLNANYEVAVTADWAIDNLRTDMHYFTAKMSVDYNFSERDISPFVTADVGYASIHAHADCTDFTCESPSDDASGAALGAGGGYKFFRNSYVQVGILGRYNIVLASTRRGTPMKTSVQGVLYF